MSSEEGGKGYLYISKTFNLASDRYGGCALAVNIYEQTCTYLERSVHLLLSESVREKYRLRRICTFHFFGGEGAILNFGLYRVQGIRSSREWLRSS
jgi:hypothetical protein